MHQNKVLTFDYSKGSILVTCRLKRLAMRIFVNIFGCHFLGIAQKELVGLGNYVCSMPVMSDRV